MGMSLAWQIFSHKTKYWTNKKIEHDDWRNGTEAKNCRARNYIILMPLSWDHELIILLSQDNEIINLLLQENKRSFFLITRVEEHTSLLASSSA